MRRLLVLFGFLWLAPSAGSFGAPEPRQMPAVLVEPRGGLGHVFARLRAGGPVKIAYFGGSITAASGWRVLSRERFQARDSLCCRSLASGQGGTGLAGQILMLGELVELS